MKNGLIKNMSHQQDNTHYQSS